MKIHPLPLSWYLDNLEKHEPFGVARYGDGEWRTILAGKWVTRRLSKKSKKYKQMRKKGRPTVPDGIVTQSNTCYIGQHNSNGCTFTQALSNDLRQVLKNNRNYHHAMLRVALSNHRDEINLFLIGYHNVKWYNGDVLLNKALSGDLMPFLERLREYRVLVVGQPFLTQLEEKGIITPTAYYETPPQNAHNKKKKIENEIMQTIEARNIDLILWSTGLASKVFIDDIWEKTNGEITQIDCGSMWDIFCGQTQSRSYIRKGNVRVNDLLEVYTGKREKRPGETFRKGKN